MKILILGGGGREHALAWSVAQNPKCDALFVAPGNGGTEDVATNVALDILDAGSVSGFCIDHAIDLVIIGPEAPLAAGVSDGLRAMGIACFGPSQAAAQLEVSKSFTKEICDATGAPTAAYGRFENAAEAKAYVDAQGAPIVIKADGLAAGKGVVVATSVPEAHKAIDDMLGGEFGDAGACVVIEEFMEGEEASFFVLCDGMDVLPFGTAQDHKRVFDGDKGPNTGGMGAYSPAPIMTEALQTKCMDEIVRPTLAEMVRRGIPYQGVLYVGLMIQDGAPRLVEYNARFGDPETQAIVMRLGAQMLDAIEACVEGSLGNRKIHWADDHAMTVVICAKGYPGPYQKGTHIHGIEALSQDADHMVFHAGTKRVDGTLEAHGGRVLNATGRGSNLEEARARAYALIDAIDWEDGFYRSDIGDRALQRD